MSMGLHLTARSRLLPQSLLRPACCSTMRNIMPLNRRLLPGGDADKQSDEGLRGMLKQVCGWVGSGAGRGWVRAALQLCWAWQGTLRAALWGRPANG